MGRNLPLPQQIDLSSYLSSRIVVRNSTGGRGYDQGVRVFDCPFCGDSRARGWMHVEFGGVGCFNVGCEAEPRFVEGVLEWIRRVEDLATRKETFSFLQDMFPRSVFSSSRPLSDLQYNDFCHLPERLHSLDTSASTCRSGMEALQFCRTQWGVTQQTASRFGLTYCLTGRYCFRIIIPVVMDGQIVAFQARAFRGGDVKYLTSSYGDTDNAECGRPASALLFNYDSMVYGCDLILVEGPGDAMRLAQEGQCAVALLGVALTSEKLALLQKKEPRRVCIGLDAEHPAQLRARGYAEVLLASGVPTVCGTWVEEKDAGGGGQLMVIQEENLGSRVRARVGRRE